MAIALGMLLVGGMKPKWFAVVAVAGVLLVLVAFGVNDGLNRLLSRGPYDATYISAVRQADGDTSADSVRL